MEMTLRYMRWVFVLFLGIRLVPPMISPSPRRQLFSVDWSPGRFHLAGGVDPGSLIYAGLAIALYFLLMRSQPVAPIMPLSGMMRRWAAFWMDAVLTASVVMPVMGVLLVIVEWTRTGIWASEFERTNVVKGDGLLVAGVFVLMLSFLFLLYFSIPLTRSRPSPAPA